MQPYFIWNGVDSRQMGVIVSSYPPIIRPQERVTQQTLPGRAGTLTVTEGADIYESYTKSFVIGLRPGVDIQTIIAWLRGSGAMVFGNEPGFMYFGRILSAVQFEKVGTWKLKTAGVQFFAQPFKAQNPQEPAQTVTSSTTTLYNPGDVAARPILILGTAGNVSLQIGSVSMQITSAPAGLKIDCDACVMQTSEGSLWTGSWTGDFLRIQPGHNTVTISGGGNITLRPQWRWL